MKNKREDLDNVGVWIIWTVAALLISLFMLVTEAHASRTMHLVDQYVDDGVKVCVYATSDGRHYAEVERPRGSNCPYTHIDY